MKYLIILLAFIIACSSKETSTDYEKFTGQWKLNSIEVQDSTTDKWHQQERERQGFLIYDGIGGMGFYHVPKDYEKYIQQGNGPIDSLTKEDLYHRANAIVYFGSYIVKSDSNIIEHHIKMHNIERYWNNVGKRKYNFSGDTLYLEPLNSKSRYVWVRVYNNK